MTSKLNFKYKKTNINIFAILISTFLLVLFLLKTNLIIVFFIAGTLMLLGAVGELNDYPGTGFFSLISISLFIIGIINFLFKINI